MKKNKHKRMFVLQNEWKKELLFKSRIVTEMKVFTQTNEKSRGDLVD